jgi:hypothetical protein
MRAVAADDEPQIIPHFIPLPRPYQGSLARIMLRRGRMDKRARALFAGAERSAERLVGQLRMATSLSLGLLFAITVLARAGHTDAVLPMQIVAAISTLARI